MKQLRALIVLTAAAGALSAAASACEVYIDEGFPGPTFPPTGWGVTNETYYTQALWEQSGSGNSGHARARVSPAGGTSSMWGKTTLYSYDLTLPAGANLRVRFRYYNSMTTGGSGSQTETCRLMRGTSTVWSKNYTWSFSWIQVDETVPALAEGGRDYRFEWYFYVSLPAYQPATVYWHVDDVLITENSVGVGPSSLGRVKALYR